MVLNHMSIAESMLPEFDHETATTRALLERVPESKAEWRPHVKSMSLGHLAAHIANIPRWASATLERTEFDVNPPGELELKTPAFDSLARVLEHRRVHSRLPKPPERDGGRLRGR